MSASAMGQIALWAAVAAAVAAAVTGRRRILRVSAAVLVVATMLLGFALLAHDFSLAYVAETTSFATPWPYRLSALWGGMAGSMLFYSTLTLVIGAMSVRRKVPVRAVAAVGLFLALVTLIFANPFDRLHIPAVDGIGLLAILQHPAMIYHPPLLYSGLAVLVVPFAYLIEAAFERRDEWLANSRRWLYVSWTLLTVGMAAGANWAYLELGWGGFWAWDPVENTALMPWLAITVFIHSSRLEERGGRFRRWNSFVVGLAFALSVVGVYLTRSGATGSIHSFAEDPVVGQVLLWAAAAVMALVSVVAMRRERGERWGVVRFDRDGWLAVNTVLLTVALAFITAGSVYPAVVSVFTESTVVVDTRFFVVTILPVAIVLSALLSFTLTRRLLPLLVLTAAVGASVIVISAGRIGVLLLAPAAASLILLLLGLSSRRTMGRRLVASIAHAGIALLLVAIAGSSFGGDYTGPMVEGDVIEVSGHRIELVDVSTGEADRYLFARVTFEVDGAVLRPEIRAYEDQNVPVAEPAIRVGLRDDVIVAVSLLFPDARTVDVSVFVRPLVIWVWVGAAMVALAGLLALQGRASIAAKPRLPAREGPPPRGTTSDTASG